MTKREKKEHKEEVVLAGIPGQFWQLHEIKNRKAVDIIEEFSTQKQALKYAKRNKLRIIKIESHREW